MVMVKAPNARAEIVGTQLVGIRDTETHLVEIHAVSICGGSDVLHLELLRSVKMPKGNFLVAKVVKPGDEEKVLWSFKEEGYTGLGKIHYDRQTDEYFILLINPRPDPRHPVLERIISLMDLPRATRATMGEARDVVYVGGKWDFLKLIQVKERIARELKIGCSITKFEQGLREAMRQRQADLEAELKVQQDLEAQARKEARNKLRQEILDRPAITVWTAEDEKRWGVPVVGDQEWKMLRNNLGVVLVEQYPADPLIPVEAFFVEKSKTSGRCGKRSVKAVTFERPARQTEQPKYKFGGGFLIERDGETLTVFEADKTDFDKMVQGGMNGNTLVAISDGPKDTKGRRQIHEFDENDVRVIGMYAPLC